MASFRFHAYAANGERERGALEATDRHEAFRTLAARGLTPIELAQSEALSDIPWWAREITFFGDGVPREALAEALRQLAILLETRLPMDAALRFTADGIRHRRLRALFLRARERVSAGGRLSGSFAEAETLVPPQITALIQVGEAANRLAENTGYAATLLEQELEWRRSLRAALIYPAILVVASMLILAGLVFFLAPLLAPIFEALSAEPPPAIRGLLGVRDILVDHWIAFLIGAVALIVAWPHALRRFERPIERLLLRLPVLGPVRRKMETSRLARTLSIMLESGAPMLEALSATRDAMRLHAYRAVVDEAEASIRQGDRLANAIGKNDLIPEHARQIFKIGEESNRLAPMLRDLSIALDKETQRGAEGAVRSATPLLTLLVGGLVALLVLTTLGAILDLNELAFR